MFWSAAERDLSGFQNLVAASVAQAHGWMRAAVVLSSRLEQHGSFLLVYHPCTMRPSCYIVSCFFSFFVAVHKLSSFYFKELTFSLLILFQYRAGCFVVSSESEQVGTDVKTLLGGFLDSGENVDSHFRSDCPAARSLVV